VSKSRVPYQWSGVLIDFQKRHWADGSVEVSVSRLEEGQNVVDHGTIDLNLNWSQSELRELQDVVRAVIWEVARGFRTDQPTWRDIEPASASDEGQALFEG
jgi:hypothetical protein